MTETEKHLKKEIEYIKLQTEELISEEREACARICEQIDNIPFASILECAKAIRARGVE